MSKSSSVTANKVFIGCPWKTIRPKYVKVVEKLEHTYPIHFVLIGREQDQRAEELLDLIKRKLLSSTMAIFDVTLGNANVSLEYGIADASNIHRVLYLNVHRSNKSSDKDSAIISDLAGQKRKQWKNEQGLRQLLTDFCKNHNFTKRFEINLKRITRNLTRHRKKSLRTLSIKMIHFLDDKESVRRADLVESLLGLNYPEKDIEFLLKGFREAKLITISVGKYADVTIA